MLPWEFKWCSNIKFGFLWPKCLCKLKFTFNVCKEIIKLWVISLGCVSTMAILFSSSSNLGSVVMRAKNNSLLQNEHLFPLFSLERMWNWSSDAVFWQKAIIYQFNCKDFSSFFINILMTSYCFQYTQSLMQIVVTQFQNYYPAPILNNCSHSLRPNK